jgi:hypothetical protein
VLTGYVLDPRADELPEPWERFVAAESVPAAWHGSVVRALAWHARSPSYLGLVCDRAGTPCALFVLHHHGAASRRNAFVAAGRTAAGGVIECRLGPTSTGSGYRFASDLDGAGRRAALLALERALRERLGRRAPAVVYRDVRPEHAAAFAGAGRIARQVTPEVVVENRWDDLGAFYAELAPRRRGELRRLEAQVARDGRLVIAEERALDPASASRLAASVARRYRHGLRRATPIPAAYFHALGGLPGVEFLTYRDSQEQLLSFGTLFDDGSELADSVWGSLDLLDGGRQQLYFHHFLRAIGHLIARRRRRIALGKGLGELKLRFGGRYEERLVVGALL